MHVTTALLLALSAAAYADTQSPLGSFAPTLQTWFEKAKSYIPSAVTSPIDAGASKVAAKNVVSLTKENWASTLTPSASTSAASGPENWMVLISGGNKTCGGHCAQLERSFNESAALFSADPTAPNLGYVDCDNNKVLCSTWLAGPPAVWYIQLPVSEKGQSKAATTIHIVPLNTTTVTTQEIVAIHSKKTYAEKGTVYEGMFHPFDGVLAQFGVNMILGYLLVGFSLIPSWTFMILISFVTRNLMLVKGR